MTRAGLTPAVLTQTAAAIADTEGYDAVTVAAVARRLGVQPASLYSHVSGREDLLGRLHRRALDDLATRLADQLAGRSGRAALAGLAAAHRTLAHDHPGLWEALQRPASASTVASDGAARVAALVLASLHAYGLPPDEQVHAARLLGSVVNGLVTLGRAGALAHRTPSTDETWERSLDALHRALTTWKAVS
ncbi:TetR/AcrR family transcriptional regulator [Serinibacter arcticus]|uniref:Transcriptional regulator, TetR family n=1 Tax=Serinibacter arcticus TaxID=1655435 RepID=A0A4Z1DYL6_9MICO|nr:TetR/AcrR family transcriptional regulator [Serinibacter arcticus]TGO04606.1 Transcriptional regulator, TetR family [Serinibacter arcticus]